MDMVPLRFLPTDAVSGCRIGGPCPVGLKAQFRDSLTQYFGTFPLIEFEKTEFSIFHRFDRLGNDAARDIIAFNNQILEPSELIWVAVHPVSFRSEDSPNIFEARALELHNPGSDLTHDDQCRLIHITGCTLGGHCYVERVQVRDDVKRLEEEGYRHLLQIGEVGGDFIEGFPWDPGFLNVWASHPLDPSTYRFCVQQ
ncbi:MAG: hypothetical protein R3B84_17255 [Zavarzinella sp.]